MYGNSEASVGTNSNSIGNSAAGAGTERSGLSFARYFTSGATMQPSPGIIGEG